MKRCAASRGTKRRFVLRCATSPPTSSAAAGLTANGPCTRWIACGDTPHSGFKGLYFGSAGVVWALHYLQREGAVTLGIDPAAAIDPALAAYRAEPDSGAIAPSLWLGEAGLPTLDVL